MTRDPVVAGQFYPGTKESLFKTVESLIGEAPRQEDAIGAVSPHAGYVYSGKVAGSVLASISAKSTYVIMGPNHTGLGGPFGLDTSPSWKTPLGEVKTNAALSARIKMNCKHILDDPISHSREHSIEVQLPFLQFMQKSFTFVPITISLAGLDIYRDIGAAIAKSIRDLELEKDVAIIASSDMTHYETQASAKKKDSAAIDAILRLDEEKLEESVSRLDISMCGYAPTAIMLVAAKALGAKSARLVSYRTSGDASGDYSSVVGYAGILINP